MSQVGTTAPALFPSAFAPHVGGVEELTRQLAIEQRGRGMSPCVVTMRWPSSLPALDDVDGIPVMRHVFRVPEPTPRHLLGWAAAGPVTRRSLVSQLRARQVDLVHVQCVSGNARYAQSAARRLGVPLVVSMQGELTMDATGLYRRSAQQRRAWRRLLDAADAVTGCSQDVLDHAADAYPGSWQDRAVVVPNGVRLDDFTGAVGWPHPRRYVLGIGRMVRQKGFDLLVEAVAQLRDVVDVDLVLAGDGPELTGLRQQVADLGIGDRVTFLGSVDRAGAVSLFTGASAFVLPSRHEPQGIVVLEAMAAGAPVVAAAVGGVPETVTGDNGLLVPGQDVGALAAALRRLLSDDGLAARLVAAGRTTVAHRDWPAVTDSYDEVYRCARGRLASA